MANLMNKLFRNKSTQRFIISLKTLEQQQQRQPQLLPKLIPSTVSQPSLVNPESLNRPNIFLSPKSSDVVKSTDTLKFYPNYPLGYFSNPSSSTGFDSLAVLEVEDGEAETQEDDAGKVWADSVKKKRKKKMNKHKYKKLRKRLRRKT